MGSLTNKLLNLIHRQDSFQPFFSLQIDLTYNCNLSCTHCYQKTFHRKVDMDFKTWKFILDDFIKLTRMLDVRPLLIISGGEPLLSPYLKDIVGYMNNKSKIAILTNGTLIDSEYAHYFSVNNLVVQISLDGYDKASYESIRGDGNFDKILNGVRNLNQHNVSFSFQAVLQKNILKHIEKFFECAKEQNATSMDFARYVPASSECGVDGMRVLGEELKQAFLDIYKFSEKYNVRTSTNQPLWCLIDSKLGHPSSAGFLGLTISPEGNIQLTSRISECLGDAKEKKGLIKTYFNNNLLKRLRLGDIRDCCDCTFFSRCRGDRNISYIYENNFLGPDRDCWHWRENFCK